MLISVLQQDFNKIPITLLEMLFKEKKIINECNKKCFKLYLKYMYITTLY